jgi:hypothetical protein
MRLTGSLLLFLILALGINACFNEPKFPSTPTIQFSSIYYQPDSGVILTISFKDANGNLGLSSSDPSDINYPYENTIYFVYSGVDKPGTALYFPNGQFPKNPVQVGTGITGAPLYDTLISYKNKRTSPANDTLPPYARPWSCTNWSIIVDTINNVRIVDTLYQQLNPNAYNIFVTVLTYSDSAKTFIPFNFAKEITGSCSPGGFNGRFPILSSDLSKHAPLEGKIRYSLSGNLPDIWIAFFANEELQLKVWIQDRALIPSNVIYYPSQTGFFTLTSIEQN